MNAHFRKFSFVLHATSSLRVLMWTAFVVSTNGSCNPARPVQTPLISRPAIITARRTTSPVAALERYVERPTNLVIEDLRNGEGKPPPKDTPSSYFLVEGHGWVSEEVDLSRVALDELLRRENLGQLAPEFRREIDQFAMDDLKTNPLKTPGQYYLWRNLGDRWIAGSMPPDEMMHLYDSELHITLDTDQVVWQWNDVPVRVRCRCNLPDYSAGSVFLEARYKSVSIDGKPVQLTEQPWIHNMGADYAFTCNAQNAGSYATRDSIHYSILGRHQLQVELQIDARDGFRSTFLRHVKTISLNSQFTVQPPTPLIKFFRFLKDPENEALHYVSAAQLQTIIDHPVESLSTPAMLEFMRRRRLAELTPDEGKQLVTDLLAVQKNRSRHWFPEYGDYIEWLHDQHALSDLQWKQYGSQQLGFYIRNCGSRIIKQGDPLPFELVEVARRGDSKARRYTGAQWKLNISFPEGVTGPVSQENMHLGIDHDGDEYPVQNQATFAAATLGTHTMRAKLTDYDLTWTDRPPDLVIPTDYDLGEISFTIVPKTSDVLPKASDGK